MARLRNEQSNLRKLINRIIVIKGTDFAPSVYATIRVISIVFLIASLFLKFDPWWVGVIVTAFFCFIIFAVKMLIKDLEDPFEYDVDHKGSDEISLEVLDNLQIDIEKKFNSLDQ